MRPDVAAFRELELLVRHLSDQLASYRRRALTAEARVRELDLRARGLEAALAEAQAAPPAPPAPAAPAAPRSPVTVVSVLPDAAGADARLEEENQWLRQRLAEARERTGLLAERVRFIRQAAGQGGDR